MTLGAANLVADRNGWRIERSHGPDLAAYLTGRPVDEVATLLPRLFNLCRMAQATAARLALGLPAAVTDSSADEVIRDHMARLYVTLRQAFGLAPMAPPQAPAMLAGPSGQLPLDMAGLRLWLQQDTPLAELGRAVQAAFPPDLCVTPLLPGAAPEARALENSPAQRHARHPLMQALAASQGRSPLWRFVGILVDLAAARAEALPKPRLLADGTAVVQAARGSYFLRISQEAGRLTGLCRITPTDHQLAKGSALDLSLRSLPLDRPDLAAQLVALFDPCVPVTVAQVHHA
ncbi:hypothetical protein MCELHM10_01406 [Paracoccaceae bacterium]